MATAREIVGDDLEQIAELIDFAWTEAQEFARNHRDVIRSLGRWLDQRGEISGIEVEAYLNVHFPEVRNPPEASPAPTQAVPRLGHEIDLGPQAYIVRDLVRLDGVIGGR
jgi:hypothetical protein